MKHITSRIHQTFTKELIIELDKLANNAITYKDNNEKADAALRILVSHGVNFEELGPGTNRLAVLIDAYVYKIALDIWGIRDNWNEFTTAMELQPFVTKVYECNGVLMVAEMVTVFSKEDFVERKEEMQQILSILAEGYLLGDVGTVPKNFMNWGTRLDGSLVILDFAYIYKIKGEEMICNHINPRTEERCESFLDYDENFYNLVCPKCRQTYKFSDVRKRIDMAHELREIEINKQLAYKLTSSYEEFSGEDDEERIKNASEVIKEETDMMRDSYYYEEDENLSEEERFNKLFDKIPHVQDPEVKTTPVVDKVDVSLALQQLREMGNKVSELDDISAFINEVVESDDDTYEGETYETPVHDIVLEEPIMVENPVAQEEVEIIHHISTLDLIDKDNIQEEPIDSIVDPEMFPTREEETLNLLDCDSTIDFDEDTDEVVVEEVGHIGNNVEFVEGGEFDAEFAKVSEDYDEDETANLIDVDGGAADGYTMGLLDDGEGLIQEEEALATASDLLRSNLLGTGEERVTWGESPLAATGFRVIPVGEDSNDANDDSDGEYEDEEESPKTVFLGTQGKSIEELRATLVDNIDDEDLEKLYDDSVKDRFSKRPKYKGEK